MMLQNSQGKTQVDWCGKTREEIEKELMARMDARLATYRQFKASQTELVAMSRDIEVGTPDGIVSGRRANEGALQLLKALAEYQAALKQFTDFIMTGKIPKD
jgi:hypothetical protein